VAGILSVIHTLTTPQNSAIAMRFSLRPLVVAPLALVFLSASGCKPAASGATAANASAMPPANGPAVQAESMEKAGEYLTVVAGCNDCHTENWSKSEGKIPPADRMGGMKVGFRGEWGTVYGKNLRTIVQRMSEDRWVKVLTTADSGEGKPPMPWWNTAQMSERDLRAMYRYVKSLGPKQNGVPRGLPAGKEPTTPYYSLEPRQPGQGQ
jgi:mono/diheme cytochrome c family protein